MLRITLLSLGLSITLLSSLAYGQIPRTISYQGLLTDSLDNPKPDGVYMLTFSLYTTGVGGTPVWIETENDTVKKGLVSTILGDVAPFPQSLTFQSQYWLGIQVGNDPELTPRIQLTSVGSSFSAMHADTAVFASGASNAARVGGFPASLIPQPFTILPLDSAGQIPGSIIQGTILPGLHAATHNEGGTDQILVTTGILSDESVTGSKLADNAVTSTKITDASIQRADVAPDFKAPGADSADYLRYTPDSARISGTVPDNSITDQKIAPGQVVKRINGLSDAVTFSGAGGATVTSSNDTIYVTGVGGTVQSIQNTNNTLTITNPNGPGVTIDVKDLGIRTQHLSDSAITTSKILDGTILDADISPNTQIAASKIDTANLNAVRVGGFPASQIPQPGTILPLDAQGKIPGSVIQGTTIPGPHAVTHNEGGTDQILVTSGMINPLAVTGAHLADSSVTSEKIATAAVTSANLGPNAVQSAHIADGTIQASDLGQNSVTNSAIADNAVGIAKIAPNVLSSINGLVNDGGNININAGNNITLTTDSASSSITINGIISGGGGGGVSGIFGGSGLTGGDTIGIVTLNVGQGPGISVGSDQVSIAPLGVSLSMLADDAVNSSKVINNTLQRVDVVPAFKAPFADTADFAQSARPGGNAGGDLTGTYPNPTISNNAITSARILDGEISAADIGSDAVTTNEILNSTILFADINQNGASNGQAMKWSTATSSWTAQSDNGITSVGAGIPSLQSGTSGLTFNPNPITSTGTISIATGGVTNGMLANPSLSITPGTGLSGGGSVSLGGTTSLSLSATPVTPGNYTRPNISVDAQGRITTASNGAAVNLASEVSGNLPPANGGTGTNTVFTTGSLVFSGAGGVYSQKNSALFWDNVNNRLGLGTTVPTTRLHIAGSIKIADGTQAAGRVLTSDANGVGSWQTGPVSGSGGAGQVAFWNGPQSLSSDTNLTFTGTRLGIGTTSPLSRLHMYVGGSGPTNGLEITSRLNGGRRLTLNQGTAGQFRFTDITAQTVDLMTLDFNAQNVGIGTTNPGQKLVVSRSGAEGLEVYLGQPVGVVGLQSYDRATSAYAKMQFDASQFAMTGGNVGIGTNTPLQKLHVVGAGLFTGNSSPDPGDNAGPATRIGYSTGGPFDYGFITANVTGIATKPLVLQRNGGAVGIATLAGQPTATLDVNGTARIRSLPAVTFSSDVVADANGNLGYVPIPSPESSTNLKEILNPEGILNLSPVRFTWNQTGRDEVGLISKEVKQWVPELVDDGVGGGPDYIKYDKIALYLLDVVKDQQKRIDRLEEQMRAMQSEKNGVGGK